MTKQKSLLIILCIIGLSAIVFSQCVGTGGSGGSSAAIGQGAAGLEKTGSDSKDGVKTVKASVAMEPKEFELFSKLAQQYSDQHNGIQIEVENVPVREAYEKWKKAGQIGEAPDLMLLDNHWVQEFAALGFLQPMDEFFSSDQQNGRIGILMNQVKWNGYIWGVPKDVDPYILAWNKKAAAALSLEQAPQTAEELTAWNKSMLKPEEDRLGVYVDPTDPYAFIALSSSLTGSWMAQAPIWPDKEAVLTNLKQFYLPQEEAWNGKAYMDSYPVPSSEWSPWDKLAAGEIVALVTTVSAFKSHTQEDLAIAAMPAYNGSEQGGWLKGRSFTISSRSEHTRLLMDWIKEMTTPDMEIKYWNEARILPAQIPSYSLAPLRGDEHIHSYDWLIGQGKVLPVASETAKNLFLLQKELDKLWKEDGTLEVLLDNIEKSWIVPIKKL